MRALVTGAGGFIGHHLVARLWASGIEVMTAGINAGTDRHHRYHDFTSVDEHAALLRSYRPQQIYHLAGVACSPDPALFYQVNTAFAAALLAAIERTVKAEAVTLFVGSA